MSTVDEPCEVTVDVVGSRRRAVSISSVDSDPLERPVRRYQPKPVAAAADGSVPTANDGDEANKNNNKEMEGEGVATSLAPSSTEAAGGAAPSIAGARSEGENAGVEAPASTPTHHAEHDADDEDGGGSDDGIPSGYIATAVDTSDLAYAKEMAMLRMGITEEEFDRPMLDIVNVSEAPIAKVTSILTKNCTLVADNIPGSLLVDIGSRLCMADGAVVGTVTTILGPVTDASYAVVCNVKYFDKLVKEHGLAEESELSYDLGHNRVIFDPAMVCDVAQGTDASYVNDEELPDYARPDFSDDDAEREWKRETKKKGSRTTIPVAVAPMNGGVGGGGYDASMPRSQPFQYGRGGGGGANNMGRGAGGRPDRGGFNTRNQFIASNAGGDDMNGYVSSDESVCSFTEQEMEMMELNNNSNNAPVPTQYDRPPHQDHHHHNNNNNNNHSHGSDRPRDDYRDSRSMNDRRPRHEQQNRREPFSGSSRHGPRYDNRNYNDHNRAYGNADRPSNNSSYGRVAPSFSSYAQHQTPHQQQPMIPSSSAGTLSGISVVIGQAAAVQAVQSTANMRPTASYLAPPQQQQQQQQPAPSSGSYLQPPQREEDDNPASKRPRVEGDQNSHHQ